MFKRVLLFLLTNILVLAMISIVTSVLGLGPYLTAHGINYQSLMLFCAIWGMGGSFISLLLSKTMAKWMTKMQMLDPNTRDPKAQELLRIVSRLAQAAGLPKTPEVGVYDSPEVNAFATGPSRGNALVAVSTGLLNRMNNAEVEGVLGHEITHVANGDMVTMTLIQGVINAFVMFFSRVVAYALSSVIRGDSNSRNSSYALQYMLIFVFDIIFGLLGSLVVCYFSRHREFRADKGGAQYAGRDKMIGALEALRRTHELVDTKNQALATLKISGSPRGFAAFLMTHPPLAERIERLKSFA